MRRSREIPIVRPARSASGWTLASGLRSALGFVSWIDPRKLAPIEPWSSTGRPPPTRRTQHDTSRVSEWYSPSPRESGWISPKGSVRRYRFPCFRTRTLPRSVAFWIGTDRASTSSTPSPSSAADAMRLVRRWSDGASTVLPAAVGADGAACSIAAAGWSIGAAGALAACWPGGSPIGVARSESPPDAEGAGASRRCDTFTSGDFGETVGLVGHDEGIDQPVDVTVHDPR